MIAIRSIFRQFHGIINMKKFQISLIDPKGRNSNIELLKILAMYLIVTCHVVAELPNNTYVKYDDYVLQYFVPSKNSANLVLTIIHQLGFLGNTIFFTCSAWFLCCSERVNYRKVVSLVLDIELVSVLYLMFGVLITRGNVDFTLGVKMLFPHTFRLFWYLTCYIIIYLIHPVLNVVISLLPQRNLLAFVAVSSLTFICLNYFSQWYFGSVIISWLVLYFVVAYLRLYMPDFQQNVKRNFVMLLIGCMGIVAVPIIINILGMNIEKFNQLSMQKFDDISRWNPFHIMVSLSCLNLVRQLKPRYNTLINYFASLSLLCFLVHSNRIMRCYFIPYIWEEIYVHGFYDRIVLVSLLFGSAYFITSMVMSVIYNITFQRITEYIVPKIRGGGKRAFECLIDVLLGILK